MRIENHIIAADADVREALRMLNGLSGGAMTLFVCDAEGRPLGSVTDGDIRRALIGGTSLEGPVADVMHRRFAALRPGDDTLAVMADARAKGIALLPRLDEAGSLTDIVDLRKVRTALPLDAVLMAGGRGERLRPLTLTTPKPLLKVGGKPIIDYNVDELGACGIERVFVTVNYLKEQLVEHFDKRRNLPEVTCVAEPERLGTMGSLSLIPKPEHDNLFVMNSDLLTSLDFEAMYLHHIASGADLTVAAVPYSVSVPYAIMLTDGDRVTGLTEKPTYNYFANAGVYIMRSRLLDRIPPRTYTDAPDFIASLIDDGLKVSHFPVNGTWIDIGSPDDFRYADELMAGLRRNKM